MDKKQSHVWTGIYLWVDSNIYPRMDAFEGFFLNFQTFLSKHANSENLLLEKYLQEK